MSQSAMSTRFSNASGDGDSTTSLGSLFQCLTLVLLKSVPAQSHSSAAVMLQAYTATYSAVTSLSAEVYWSWPVLLAGQMPLTTV